MKNVQGFTLTELLIAIAIISLLAGLAYPSYQSYMIQSRRVDAKGELIKAQLQQTGLHILSPSFSTAEDDLGLPISDPYYTFSVVSADARTYVMKAVAKSGTTQARDEAACQTLFIDQSSNHTSDGSTVNDHCW